MPTTRRLLAGAAALALLGSGTAAAALPAPSTGGPGALVRVAGNLLPSLDRLASAPADPSTPMTVGVALARPHTADEEALLARLEDPRSADYHRFPSADELARRFAVPAARTADVVRRLRAAGLDVEQVDRLGDYVSARGTVAQVQRAFSVTERVYTGLKGARFLANTQPPLLPAADGVLTVVGLNTLQHFTRGSDVHHAAPAARPHQDTCVQGTCTGTTTPEDLWSIYEQPRAYEGQGVRMAIIGEGNPVHLQGWLRTQEAKYRLPQVPFVVKCVQKGGCGTDTSGDGEWQIDTQASGGMAPRSAGEVLYFAQSITDPDLNTSFIAWADDAKGPRLASASLGECESSPANGVFTGPLAPTDGNLTTAPTGVLLFGNGESAAVDPALRYAALQGKTLFASTGDTGSSCPVVNLPALGAGNGVLNNGVPQQNYPAVSPYAVGVGGTVVYGTQTGSSAGTSYDPSKPPAKRAQEYAWPYTGGGSSLYQVAPAFQQGIANLNRPCVISPDGSPAATGQLCRGLPDVAAQSGDVLTNGYSVFGTTGGTSTGFTNGGGTSLSSPLWMGMWARVQGAAGRNLGPAGPLLYAVGKNPTTYARDFYDITVGTNGLYQAQTGWDYVSGFGAPRVAGLIADIAKPAAPVKATRAKATPVRRTKARRSTRRRGRLPRTGAPAGVAAAGLGLLGGGIALRRRRSAR